MSKKYKTVFAQYNKYLFREGSINSWSEYTILRHLDYVAQIECSLVVFYNCFIQTELVISASIMFRGDLY